MRVTALDHLVPTVAGPVARTGARKPAISLTLHGPDGTRIETAALD